MAKIGNRVKETSDTTGTGTLDLNGAPTGFRAFSDELTSADEVYYLIVDDPDSPTEYEFGVGTFTAGTPDTLSRDTVHGSSNADAKVSFSAGTKTVISTALVETFRTIEVTNDAGDVALTVGNTAGSGSTDETASLVFQHAGQPGGKIVSGRIGTYAAAGTEDGYLAFHTAINGADVEVMRIIPAINGLDKGAVLIGDTANSLNVLGLTINQDTDDGEILSLKSSDVAHGFTSETETDTFGLFTKARATNGGLRINAMHEDSGNAEGIFQLYAFTPQTFTTTKTTVNWNAAMEMRVLGHNGAGSYVNATANGNVLSLAVYKGGAQTFIFGVDVEGDTHQDGTSGTAFDEYDDALAVRLFDLHRDAPGLIRSEFDRFVKGNRKTLERIGVLGRITQKELDAGARPLVNTSQLQRLHNGAIWQQYVRTLAIVEELEAQVPGFAAAVQSRLSAARMPGLPINI